MKNAFSGCAAVNVNEEQLFLKGPKLCCKERVHAHKVFVVLVCLFVFCVIKIIENRNFYS